MSFNNLNENDFSDLDINNLQKTKDKQFAREYNLYRKLFTEYLIKKLELKKYDGEIINSDLNFKTVDEEKKDVYQYFLGDELKYFYIRNNIYIERLTEEEKRFLDNKLKEGNETLDDETQKFIEKTYAKMIFEDVGQDGKKYITFYGPNSSSFTAENDSVVIGIRYDEFYSDGLDDETWDDLHMKQMMYLEDVIYKLVDEQAEKLSVPMTVLQYSDFSIRTRNLNNKSIKKISPEEEER